MKRTIIMLILLTMICLSCSRNVLEFADTIVDEQPLSIKSLATKSSAPTYLMDSLQLELLLQSDPDNLMINRIVFNDSIYSLTISRESAYDVGVTQETYDKYLDYLEQLNESF